MRTNYGRRFCPVCGSLVGGRTWGASMVKLARHVRSKHPEDISRLTSIMAGSKGARAASKE